MFALVWLVPGFGAIDLTVTWDPEWPQVLEAGWGVFFTFLVAAPFVLVAVRPSAARPGGRPARRRDRGARRLGAPRERGGRCRARGRDSPSRRRRRRPPRDGMGPAGARRDMSVPLLALGAVGAGPWLAYAFQMWAANRRGPFDCGRHELVDHYSVQGGLGLALAALPALAGVRADLRRLVPACCGVAAAYLGLVSYAWPDAAGGFGRAWSVAAMAWGARAGHRGGRGRRPGRVRIVAPE